MEKIFIDNIEWIFSGIGVFGLGMLLSIIGYLINSWLDRKAKVLEIKQQYYHKFLEAFIEKMSYQNKLTNSDQEIKKMFDKATEKFAIEVSRLPLYASADVIAFIENCKNSNDSNNSNDINDLYNLIRKDLTSSSFKLKKSIKTSATLF